MALLKWYKRDPVAAIEGMAVLTLEERGAYNTVLDLIYAHDGAFVDDDRLIARHYLHVDVRRWRRIRKRLLDLEKLYVLGTNVRNARADREVDSARLRVLSAANAGKASWEKRQATMNILKSLRPTAVQRAVEPIHIQNKNPLTQSIIAARAREPER